MSVKLSFVRFSSSTQVTSSPTTTFSCRGFDLVSAMFHGFKGKTHTRVKNFPSVAHYQSYLNKLSAGGWMNDEDYNFAYLAGTALYSLEYSSRSTVNHLVRAENIALDLSEALDGKPYTFIR